MTNWIHAVAARKWVTASGLVLAAVGVICAENSDQIALVFPKYGKRACAVATLAGTLMASLGRGLAERRQQAPRYDHHLFIGKKL